MRFGPCGLPPSGREACKPPWVRDCVGSAAIAWRMLPNRRPTDGRMKVRQIIKLIEAEGWYRIKAKGGHRQYKHPVKPGRVTVPGKMSADLDKKTARSILKQAGLDK